LSPINFIGAEKSERRFHIIREFNFLTAHGEALSIIAKRPYISTSEMASTMGITRSKARKVMAELITDGYINRIKNGSESTYQIAPNILLDDEKRQELELCNYLESLLKKKS
jgi:predicted transcriptional regulator of viral defense system